MHSTSISTITAASTTPCSPSTRERCASASCHRLARGLPRCYRNLDICLGAIGFPILERLNLKLVLAGMAVVDEPSDFTANGGPCKEAKDGHEHVRLGYRIEFQEGLRETSLYVFDQRDKHGKVTLSLRGQGDERVKLTPTKDVTMDVELTKRGRAAFLSALIVFLGLAGSLVWLDRSLKWNVLRGAAFDRKQFLCGQIKRLESMREKAEAMRTVLVTDALTNEPGFDKTAVPSWIEYRGFDAAAREESREKLLLALKGLGSFADPEQRIGDLFTAYRELLDRAKELNADMKLSAGKDLDPLAQPESFSHGLEFIDQRPKYSLGRCQMAWWTLLVISGFVLMWVSTETLSDLPESILWLMGISVSTAGAAFAIDVQKTHTSLPSVPSGNIFQDILRDPSGGMGFSRWQILIWSLLLGVVFSYILIDSFLFTDFETTWLGLMGISSGTYVGFKIPERSPEQAGWGDA